MKVDVYDLTGTKIEQINLTKNIFEAKINESLMAQAVRIYQGNQRKALAKTLTRSEVSRTTKKVYRQKGTGQARHGSRKAPIYIGGGVAQGPRGNQNYNLCLPKKMKIAALKSALSLLAKEKKIIIIKGFAGVKKPNTKGMAKLIEKLIEKQKQRKIGVVTDLEMEMAVKSLRNLSQVNLFKSDELTTYNVISSHWLLFAVESIKTLEKRLDK